MNFFYKMLLFRLINIYDIKTKLRRTKKQLTNQTQIRDKEIFYTVHKKKQY